MDDREHFSRFKSRCRNIGTMISRLFYPFYVWLWNKSSSSTQIRLCKSKLRSKLAIILWDKFRILNEHKDEEFCLVQSLMPLFEFKSGNELTFCRLTLMRSPAEIAWKTRISLSWSIISVQQIYIVSLINYKEYYIFHLSGWVWQLFIILVRVRPPVAFAWPGV